MPVLGLVVRRFRVIGTSVELSSGQFSGDCSVLNVAGACGWRVSRFPLALEARYWSAVSGDGVLERALHHAARIIDAAGRLHVHQTRPDQTPDQTPHIESIKSKSGQVVQTPAQHAAHSPAHVPSSPNPAKLDSRSFSVQSASSSFFPSIHPNFCRLVLFPSPPSRFSTQLQLLSV